MALLLCGGCSRHIQKSHTTCPFCGATEGHVPGARPTSRATRALLLFSAAAVSAALPAGCSTDKEAADAGITDVSTDAAYGGADGPFRPFEDAAFDAPAVSTDAAYGAPDAPFSRPDAADGAGNDGGADGD